MKEKSQKERQLFYLDTKTRYYLQRASLVLLFSLLAIDVVFMGLHSLKSLGHLTDPNFSVTKNFGYAETFQYLKAGFIAGCFIWLSAKFKKPLFYCWAAVFSYILIDDSLEVHEKIGFSISRYLDPKIPFIGIGNTAGELIAFGLFGLLLFVPLFYFFYKSNNAHLKILSQDLFILFIGLTAFGIAVDLLHDFATTGTIINGLLGLIEDGGEMVIMSIMVWYIWAFIKNDRFFEKRKTRKTEIKNSPDLSVTKNRDRTSIPTPQQAKRSGIPRS